MASRKKVLDTARFLAGLTPGLPPVVGVCSGHVRRCIDLLDLDGRSLHPP